LCFQTKLPYSDVSYIGDSGNLENRLEVEADAGVIGPTNDDEIYVGCLLLELLLVDDNFRSNCSRI